MGLTNTGDIAILNDLQTGDILMDFRKIKFLPLDRELK
jgi:hypothetical protein